MVRLKIKVEFNIIHFGDRVSEQTVFLSSIIRCAKYLFADPSEEMSDAVIESIEFERKAIIATQENQYNEALDLFEKAIGVAPSRASVYNNRAQTMRLLNDDAGK